jgi:hypothetical protein
MCLTSMVLIVASYSVGCMAVYQAKSKTGQGYSEARLDDGTFDVVYTGSRYTAPERQEVFLLYRCAQLTVQHGYEHFVVLKKNTETNRLDDSIHTNEAVTVPRDTGHFHPAAHSSNPVDNQDNFRSSALIKMFNGSKANVPVSYNAKETMAHLRVRVYGERDIVRNPPSNNPVSREVNAVGRDFQAPARTR